VKVIINVSSSVVILVAVEVVGESIRMWKESVPLCFK
jgi:hypothetical protein